MFRDAVMKSIVNGQWLMVIVGCPNMFGIFYPQQVEASTINHSPITINHFRMMNRKQFLFAVVSLFLLSTSIHAQEWTRFRGPNGAGVSNAKTVPVNFAEGDFNWRVKLPGEGHSSPVIWGNRIFLTSAEASAGKWHVLCLNAADGRELWRKTYNFKPYRKHDLNSFASSTPTVDEQAVYASMITPEAFTVLAFNHSGNELWKRNLGTYQAGNGNGASPIVVGDVVVIANDQEGNDNPQSANSNPESSLIGLDRKTGVVKWKHKRAKPGPASYATPIVYEPKSGAKELIFISTAHGITSLNPTTGTLNWELADLSKLRCIASPVLANGLIVMITGVGASGDRKGFTVHPGSKSVPAKVAYEIPRQSFSQVPTPIAVGDLIFFWGDGGIVNCLRASTGEPVWKERVGGNFYGSPVCVNGKLYAMNGQGELAVIEASDKFKLLAKIPLGEGSHSTPSVSNGVMYLRTMGHLISVGGKKAVNQ
jgi:outer membrane protein assembly factor BamB